MSEWVSLILSPNEINRCWGAFALIATGAWHISYTHTHNSTHDFIYGCRDIATMMLMMMMKKWEKKITQNTIRRMNNSPKWMPCRMIKHHNLIKAMNDLCDIQVSSTVCLLSLFIPNKKKINEEFQLIRCDGSQVLYRKCANWFRVKFPWYFFSVVTVVRKASYLHILCERLQPD